MSKWRNSTFLPSVQRTPSKGPVESVTERSSSLFRLAPALGMPVFRAASADLDVKVAAVNDPFQGSRITWSTSSIRQNPQAVQRTVASLGPWTICTGSRNLEPSFAVVVKAAHTLTITIECVEKNCSLYFLCRCGVACPGWMLLVLSRRLNDQMSDELVG